MMADITYCKISYFSKRYKGDGELVIRCDLGICKPNQSPYALGKEEGKVHYARIEPIIVSLYSVWARGF